MSLPPNYPAAQRTRPVTLRPEPNVTPMIDVLLVLLIIFMAAIPEQRKGLTGHLPPDESTAGTAPAGIVLEVGPGARYAINRQSVPAAELTYEIRAIYQGRPDKVLIVRGHRSARFQEVVTAVDIARGAGVQVVGFDTRP